MTQYSGYLVIFLLLLCSSCSEDEEEKVATTTTNPQHSVKEKASQPINTKRVTLNDDIIEDYLIAFGAAHLESNGTVFTNYGNIEFKLYKETPLHRASFVMICEERLFDYTKFTRVVDGFIIQGGGTDDEDISFRRGKMGHYTIPPEFLEGLFHKRGALAAARKYKGNPNKHTSPFSFYFVDGTVYKDQHLEQYGETNKRNYTEAQRIYYKTIGGAAHLDGQHTVFGEITKGLEIVDRIARAKTDRSEWPLTDILIDSVRVY